MISCTETDANGSYNDKVQAANKLHGFWW